MLSLLSERKKIAVTALILVVASFSFFQFFYAYHLFFREQMQLFLFAPDYLLSYFNRPAWLACLFGDFLTQFFYLRAGGPLIVALILVAEYILSTLVLKRVSRTTHCWLWAILPVAVDWMLYLKLSYNLSSSIGFIVCLLLFILYTSLSKLKGITLYTGIVLSIAGYWLAGSSIFIFPVLVLLFESQRTQSATVRWKLFFLLNWLSPYVFARIYLLPIGDLYIFPGTLLQTIALPLSLVVVSLLAGFFGLLKIKSHLPEIIIVSALAAAIVGVGIQKNASFNFEKVLSMDSEYYFGNHEKVIALADKYKMHSKYAAYFTNLAFAETGKLPDKALNYYQPGALGMILPVAPTESREAIVFSNEAFYAIGDMNLAQHSAMLGNTFSPLNRSSRMMKRLAEINLVIGDSVAAEKYLRLLKKTLFHRKWAESHEKLNCPTPKSKWLKYKRSLLPENDTIRQASDYLASIAYLVEQQPKNKTAVDYYLCSLLLNKDLDAFKTAYDKYVKPNHQAVPKIYSEALLIILYRQHVSIDEAKSYGISPLKVNEFVKYNQLYEQNKGAMEPLKKDFGRSYWFYYQFANLVTNG